MKIVVVDDHPIMRLGIRQLVVREWPQAEVHEAETIELAVHKLVEHQPDVVVLDLLMPDTSGTEGVSQVLRAARSTPILVLSGNAESVYAARLLKMGVSGYLQKDRAADELVVALRRLMAGGRYVTPSLADHLVDLLDGRAGSGPRHELLSTQEYRVMVLMAAGKTPATIAKAMFLSVKTVGTYRARIFEKMGWKTNAELTKYCVQHGLTETN